MKISEYKGEAAIELLADLLEPASIILTDEKVKKVIAETQEKKITPVVAVSRVLKLHKKEIIEIMARLDGVPVKKYECNIISLPKQLLEILNDEELMVFFKSQAEEMMQSESFGLRMENIEAGEK